MLTKKLADLTLKRVVEVAKAFEIVQNKHKMWNVEKIWMYAESSKVKRTIM